MEKCQKKDTFDASDCIILSSSSNSNENDAIADDDGQDDAAENETNANADDLSQDDAAENETNANARNPGDDLSNKRHVETTNNDAAAATVATENEKGKADTKRISQKRPLAAVEETKDGVRFNETAKARDRNSIGSRG